MSATGEMFLRMRKQTITNYQSNKEVIFTYAESLRLANTNYNKDDPNLHISLCLKAHENAQTSRQLLVTV
jgi:hypothetical protein